MDKQTKLLLGLGLIGVGGYMLWKQGQKAPVVADASADAPKSFTGNAGRRMRGANGKRKKKNMAMMAGGTVEAHQSTFNANGSSDTFGHGGFFDVQSKPLAGSWKGFVSNALDVKSSSLLLQEHFKDLGY